MSNTKWALSAASNGRLIGRTEEVDDGVVVAGEEADEVLEERDERRVHHAVVDLPLSRLQIAQCTMHNAH